MMRLPPQLQAQYDDLVNVEQSLRTIINQQGQMKHQKSMIENAISEIEATKEINPDTTIYKSAGVILIKVPDMDKTLEELKEKEELLNIRITTLDKQIKRLEQTLNTKREQFKQAAQQMTQAQDFKKPM